MYNLIYKSDTPENRKSFLESWICTLCHMQEEINYGISGSTLANNFTRYYFDISEKDIIFTFIEHGYRAKVKEHAVYFNLAPDSPSIKEFRKGWD